MAESLARLRTSTSRRLAETEAKAELLAHEKTSLVAMFSPDYADKVDAIEARFAAERRVTSLLFLAERVEM